MVDLMAAVPSVVYGLWGLFFLQGHAIGDRPVDIDLVCWIPIFKVNGANPNNPLVHRPRCTRLPPSSPGSSSP